MCVCVCIYVHMHIRKVIHMVVNYYVDVLGHAMYCMQYVCMCYLLTVMVLQKFIRKYSWDIMTRNIND